MIEVIKMIRGIDRADSEEAFPQGVNIQHQREEVYGKRGKVEWITYQFN